MQAYWHAPYHVVRQIRVAGVSQCALPVLLVWSAPEVFRVYVYACSAKGDVPRLNTAIPDHIHHSLSAFASLDPTAAPGETC